MCRLLPLSEGIIQWHWVDRLPASRVWSVPRLKSSANQFKYNVGVESCIHTDMYMANDCSSCQTTAAASSMTLSPNTVRSGIETNVRSSCRASRANKQVSRDRCMTPLASHDPHPSFTVFHNTSSTPYDLSGNPLRGVVLWPAT